MDMDIDMPEERNIFYFLFFALDIRTIPSSPRTNGSDPSFRVNWAGCFVREMGVVRWRSHEMGKTDLHKP
jgi:hypothetical protein